MEKKRIGIECESIEDTNQGWGIGRMIRRLLEEISERPELQDKYQFTLYFKDQVPDLPFLKSPMFETKVVPVPFARHRLFPIYYFALLPLRLWFERLDWMFWPNYMLPIIAPGRSIVTLTEDVYHEAHAGGLPFRYRLAYLIFAWWSAKRASKIITFSEVSRRTVARLYQINPRRLAVNYLGVETFPTPRESQATPPVSSNYVLYVGQAFPRRHLAETIKAFEKLSATHPNLELVAVGYDKYRPPVIEKLIGEVNNRLGRRAITHHNYVSEVELRNLYQNARTLVYVSDREAFGLPPMESLAYGVPVVIANNELGHELFHDYAFYAKTSDTEGIAKALDDALSQDVKRQKIAAEGPGFVKKYNWPAFTDRFLSLLSSP